MRPSKKQYDIFLFDLSNKSLPVHCQNVYMNKLSVLLITNENHLKWCCTMQSLSPELQIFIWQANSLVLSMKFC